MLGVRFRLELGKYIILLKMWIFVHWKGEEIIEHYITCGPNYNWYCLYIVQRSLWFLLPRALS